MVNIKREPLAVGSSGPLQHLQVTIGVAKGGDRMTADVHLINIGTSAGVCLLNHYINTACKTTLEMVNARHLLSQDWRWFCERFSLIDARD